MELKEQNKLNVKEASVYSYIKYNNTNFLIELLEDLIRYLKKPGKLPGTLADTQ